MRTLTRRNRIWLGWTGLCLIGALGCTPVPADPSTGGNGSGGDGTGANGAGGAGDGGNAACGTQALVTGATFSQTAGPWAATFTHVAAMPKHVFATTGEGIHRSDDGGATWEYKPLIGPAGHNIQAMTIVGESLFVTTQWNVFVSADAGETWKDISTSEVQSASDLTTDGETLFALSQTKPYRWNAASETWEPLPWVDAGFDVIEANGSELYADSIYPAGVLRMDLKEANPAWVKVNDLPEWGYKDFAFSDGLGVAGNATKLFRTADNGASWTEVALGQSATTWDVLATGGTFIASTSQGTLISKDGGVSWTKAEGIDTTNGRSLAFDGEHVFSAANGLYRADTEAAKWESLPVAADEVQRITSTGTAVFATSKSGFWRTKDEGGSWERIELPEDAYPHRQSLVSDGGALFVVGGQHLYTSKDDGASFQMLYTPIDTNGKGMVSFLTKGRGGLLLAVQEGAGLGCQDATDITTKIYVSKDEGVSWQPAMTGMPITFTDCYGYEFSPWVTGLAEAGDNVLVATFHEGLFRSTDGGATFEPLWTQAEFGSLDRVFGADGVLFASTKASGVLRSTDGGATWEPSSLGDLRIGAMLAVGDTMFAGIGQYGASEGGVRYSTDKGASWSNVSADFLGRTGTLTVHGDTLFAGTMDSSAWVVPLACAPAP